MRAESCAIDSPRLRPGLRRVAAYVWKRPPHEQGHLVVLDVCGGTEDPYRRDSFTYECATRRDADALVQTLTNFLISMTKIERA